MAFVKCKFKEFAFEKYEVSVFGKKMMKVFGFKKNKKIKGQMRALRAIFPNKLRIFKIE